MRAAAFAIGVQVLASLAATPTGAAPLVSLWYRGSPAGTPRPQDLEAIRAAGFAGVTWPSRQTAGTAEVARLAADLGLRVTLRIDPVPLTAASARAPGDVVDVPIAGLPPEEFAAVVWRAVAHGAGVISFDPGATSGTGLEDAAGHPRPWVQPALAVAAQLATQAQLVSEWRPAERVALEGPRTEAIDLQLLEDGRSWILVVTNTARARARAVARLPAGVPAALWVNLLDGSMLSMIREPAGARWSLDLEAGAARVYVVSK
jgi:hypothetical protein